MQKKICIFTVFLFIVQMIFLQYDNGNINVPSLDQKHVVRFENQKCNQRHKIELQQKIDLEQEKIVVISEKIGNAVRNTGSGIRMCIEKVRYTPLTKPETITIKIKYRPQSARRSLEKEKPYQKRVEIFEQVFYNEHKEFRSG